MEWVTWTCTSRGGIKDFLTLSTSLVEAAPERRVEAMKKVGDLRLRLAIGGSAKEGGGGGDLVMGSEARKGLSFSAILKVDS